MAFVNTYVESLESKELAQAGEVYLAALRKALAKGGGEEPGFLAAEAERLTRVMATGSVTAAKKTAFMMKRNVILALVEAIAGKEEEERPSPPSDEADEAAAEEPSSDERDEL